MDCFGVLVEVLMRCWVINERRYLLGLSLIGLSMAWAPRRRWFAYARELNATGLYEWELHLLLRWSVSDLAMFFELRMFGLCLGRPGMAWLMAECFVSRRAVGSIGFGLIEWGQGVWELLVVGFASFSRFSALDPSLWKVRFECVESLSGDFWLSPAPIFWREQPLPFVLLTVFRVAESLSVRFNTVRGKCLFLFYWCEDQWNCSSNC